MNCYSEILNCPEAYELTQSKSWINPLLSVFLKVNEIALYYIISNFDLPLVGALLETAIFLVIPLGWARLPLFSLIVLVKSLIVGGLWINSVKTMNCSFVSSSIQHFAFISIYYTNSNFGLTFGRCSIRNSDLSSI